MSQNDVYKVGEQVNLLEALYYDSSFSSRYSNITKVTFPIISNQKVNAFINFFLDRSDVWGKTQQEKIFYVFRGVERAKNNKDRMLIRGR